MKDQALNFVGSDMKRKDGQERREKGRGDRYIFICPPLGRAIHWAGVDGWMDVITGLVPSKDEL